MIRILAGYLKNKAVKFHEPVRPTTSRVKNSIFETIKPLDGKRVLDLFAGSGALSFEALSRGAAFAILVDASIHSYKIIKENLIKLSLEGKAELYLQRWEIAIKALAKREQKFDIIFLDPPYFYDKFGELLEKIYLSNILDKKGLIVVEHYKNVDLTSNFKIRKSKKFGSTIVTYLELKDV